MNNLPEKSLQLLAIILRRTALYGYSNMRTYVRPWPRYSLTLHSYNDKKKCPCMQNYAFANLFMCREYAHFRDTDVSLHLTSILPST